MEIWKDIPGYENIYQVSNYGSIKSFKKNKESILKTSKNFKGYNIVCLYKNNKQKLFQVHVLVAMAFLNHTPCGHKLVVNHKDFNRSNNYVNNLEVITNRENCNLKHKKHSSRYTGVCWDKSANKWYACITINGKNKGLGKYINEYDAHLAYENKLKEIIDIKS